MFSKLFGKKRQGIIGYIYIADSDEGILNNVSAGQTISTKKKGPPWIVVDHGFEQMIIAQWPGTLWRAEVIEEAKDTGLLDYAHYTRANSVNIIEELPLDILFGDSGAGVLKIIDSVSDISLDAAQKLASELPEQALELYSKGWNIFGGTKDSQAPFYGHNHQDTISMTGDEGRSPINCAFDIIYAQVFDHAKALTGGKAILTDEQGDLSLNAEWSKACSSYLCAAMALAYTDQYSADEFNVLVKAWESVHGKMPTKR